MLKSRNWLFRLLAVAMCVICAVSNLRPLGVTAAGEGEAASQMSEHQYYATEVRYGPSFSQLTIGRMENGTEISVLGQTKEFYKVDCYDMVGYIAKTQVSHTEDGKYYVNCDPASKETVTLTYTDHAAALTLRYSLLELAKKQLGSPYVYGGSRPGAFDCSGLMQYLYKQNGVDIRRNARQQMQDGVIVAKEGLLVGDLILFREAGTSGLCSHVGIYAGNNQIIHAGHSGVVYADLDTRYFVDSYLCARRIVNTGMSCVTVEEAPAALPVTTPTSTGRRTR